MSMADSLRNLLKIESVLQMIVVRGTWLNLSSGYLVLMSDCMEELVGGLRFLSQLLDSQVVKLGKKRSRF